jgi:eukaryotic-like serine/threonine-protein kinase
MISISTPDLVEQLVLGRYRIIRRLAHGGMGAVYLGRTEGAEGFARPVVIKRVLPGLTKDREVAQMFVREARILSNLQHPNIVSVVDFGQQDDGAYLMVLEYVHGYQLAQWHRFVAEARGLMPFQFGVHIAAKVLDALHYAHTFRRSDGTAMQIIHRDVTPTNVLLNDQGIVKLLDFGIARVSGDHQNATPERSRVRGKLPYLPVEAFRGVEPSVQSDVYSAGVMLYELLSGTNPFIGRELADTYVKVFEVEADPLHSLRNDIPQEIDPVLRRAMHKDASKRFDSAAEFASALRALRDEPEDVIAARLAAQVHTDFYADLPAQLVLERLQTRELAWRGPESKSPAAQADEIIEHLTFSTSPTGDLPLESATVRASIPAALLAAACPSVAPHSPDTDDAGTESDELQRATPSARRGAWISTVAASISAIAALFAWFVVRPAPVVREQVVLIQREPAPTPAAAATQPAMLAMAAEPPAAAVAPPLPRADPEASETAEMPSSGAAAAPDPRVLTRVFGRKQARVQSCFTKHAAKLPSLPPVFVHFKVAESGQVAEALISPSDVAGSALGRCLLDVARGTRFGRLRHAVSFHIPISVEKISAGTL